MSKEGLEKEGGRTKEKKEGGRARRGRRDEKKREEKLGPPKEGKKSAFVSKTPLKAVCFLLYPPF